MTGISSMPNVLKTAAKSVYRYISSFKTRKKISSLTNLSLGDSGFPFAGFVSAGFGGVIQLDITKRPPSWMHGKYKMIYSERMLEHISSDQIALALKNISLILADDGMCRMSLPVCFSGIPTNMMRAGNANKCKELGHVTWFTKEGFGAVNDEFFGLFEAPVHGLTLWQDVLEGLELEIHFHRSYKSSGEQVNDSCLTIDGDGYYSDFKAIRTNRPHSLIFDIIKPHFSRQG